jgi:hypothetical protein
MVYNETGLSEQIIFINLPRHRLNLVNMLTQVKFDQHVTELSMLS